MAFVLTTLAGVALAPLAYELNAARKVAEEARIIRAMKGNYGLSSPGEHFSARLARMVWPWRNEFLTRHVEGASFGNAPSDLSELANVPSVQRLTIYGPITIHNSNFTHDGVRAIHVYADAQQDRSQAIAEARLLARFPNLVEVQLARAVPQQSMVDDLGSCTQLRKLLMSFDKAFVLGQWNDQELAAVSFAPLGRLQNLRQLELAKVARSTDWSFLADLPQLEEVKLTPTGSYSLGGTLESWTKNYGSLPPAEESPFHYLSQLRGLKKIELFGTPAYSEDIRRLLANSKIEELRLDALPDGLESLRALQEAKSLRKLHVTVSFFADKQDEARVILEGLHVRHLSFGPPFDNGR
jgi:hypothetical protein